RPAVDLEEMLDLAFDVEPPRGLVGSEPERLERNGQLHRPPGRRACDRRVPDAIPVPTEALRVVGDLAVGPGSGGVHLEEEPVAMIKEGIEHDRDAVVDVEVGIPRELREDDAAGMRLVADDPDIQSLIVKEHTDISGFRRRPAFYGLAL